MSVFVRRFLFDPGNTVLLNIESVNILDLDPPAAIAGVGTGTVLIVGEFENGPFNVPLQSASSTDFSNTWGQLGFQYGSVVANNPCAVNRFADGAVVGENWNGNGFIQLNGKQFAALVVCRVDTSVGAVTFSPQPYITGAIAFRYALAPGQILSLDAGSGFTSATFSATAGTVTSGAQTFPDGFVGGETLTLGYDAAPNFTVTFLSGDTTQAAVIARINQYAGFTFAASVTGTTMSLTGIAKGNQAQVRVVGSSGGSVLTNLGLTVATTFGTGNVQNIAAVTAAEVNAVVSAAVSNTVVEVDQNGALRISRTGGTASSWIAVGSATTATNLGFTPGQYGSTLGVAQVLSSGGTFSMAVSTITLGFDSNPNVTVTFAGTEVSVANVVSTINSFFSSAVCVADGSQLRLFGAVPGGQVRIVSVSANSVLTLLGLSIGTTQGTPLPAGQSIPAGTVVQQTGAGQVLVTMQDVTFTSTGVQVAGSTLTPTLQPTFGPYTVKVRHALDNGTGTSCTAGTITVIPTPPTAGSFSVTNPQGTTAALTESQIDAQYTTAINATTDINSVGRLVNVVYAARQSNVVRRALRTNALQASAQGCFGRMAVIRPPLGTTKIVATSVFAEPGVGAYRDQRVIYTYPGVSTFVPLIARRGVAGGLGFTASGNIDVGADGFMASILSQLNPEENPGQETPFTTGAIGLESSANAQGFQIGDYITFKASGIAAPRFDNGVMSFQSGVTSVDPTVSPNLVRIARRRMADFIQDTLAQRGKAYGKRLSTFVRRSAVANDTTQFMEDLLSRNQPANQRIAGYTVDKKSGNTPTTVGQGLYKIVLSVRTLSSLDSIVFETTVGDQVTVTEQLPQAAA